MEVLADGGGTLSIVLVGHPKLRNDLRRPTMEEIGYRATVFFFDGITGSQRPVYRLAAAHLHRRQNRCGRLDIHSVLEFFSQRFKPIVGSGDEISTRNASSNASARCCSICGQEVDRGLVDQLGCQTRQAF